MLYSWAETLQCYSVSLYPCIQAAGCEYPLVVSYYSSFSLSRNKHGTKKKTTTRNRRVEEAEKMKCYKTLIYKQFVQVSGLCDPQFLSYLPKHLTHLCRAWYGVDQCGRRKSTKHLVFTFSVKALSFHSRASIRAHKHVF